MLPLVVHQNFLVCGKRGPCDAVQTRHAARAWRRGLSRRVLPVHRARRLLARLGPRRGITTRSAQAGTARVSCGTARARDLNVWLVARAVQEVVRWI